MATDGGGRTPTPAQAQCGACGDIFNSVSTFDSHRDGPVDHRVCLPPPTLGFQNFNGIWAPPEYQKTLDKLAVARESKNK